MLLLVALTLRAGTAVAAEPKTPTPASDSGERAPAPRIVVDHFQGDARSRKRIRSEVTRVLEREPSVDLISVKLLDAHRTHDVSVDGSAEGYAEVAGALKVVALIRGRVVKTGPSYLLSLVVLSGADGRRLGRVEFEASGVEPLRERISEGLWREIEPLILQAGTKDQIDAGGEDVVEEDAPDSDDPGSEQNPYLTEGGQAADPALAPAPYEPSELAPTEPGSARGCSWLEIAPGGGLMMRSFGYEDERSGALRAYTLSRAAMAALDVSFYPVALANCRVASGIGIHLGYEHMLPVTSRIADRDLETSGLAARAELGFRIPVGAVTLEPAAGYYRRRFAVEGDYVPDVDHQALGARLRLGVRLGVFIAEAHGSGRFVLASGEIGSSAWFPESSAIGFDAGALAGVAPAPWLDLFLSAKLERWAFDLNPAAAGAGAGLPARPNGVADGASDRYTSFMLGLRFRLSTNAARL